MSRKGMALEATIKEVFKKYKKLGIPAYKLHEASNFQEKSPFDFFIFFNNSIYCFDAKECKGDSLNIKTNLKLHQIDAMNAIVNNGGIAFFLIYFFKEKTLVKLYVKQVLDYIAEGKKSITAKDCIKTGIDIIGVFNNVDNREDNKQD